jgi:hypothetical protein
MFSRLATWLLERVLHAADREALAGDVLETYANGRTTRWLWRQVFHALLLSAADRIPRHRLLTVQAVLATTALLMLWLAPVSSLSEAVTGWGLFYAACGFVALLLSVTRLRSSPR